MVVKMKKNIRINIRMDEETYLKLKCISDVFGGNCSSNIRKMICETYEKYASCKVKMKQYNMTKK